MADDQKLLAANLAVLRARHPHVLRAVDGLAPYPDAWMSVAKSGDPVIAVPGPRGADLPLHSRYRPREEARALVRDEDDPLATWILLGGGLGYMALELARRASDQNRLYWIEADPRLFRTLIGLVDIRPVADRKLARILVGLPPHDLHAQLLSEVVEMLAAPIRLLAHPPSVERQRELYDGYREAIDQFRRQGTVQLSTALHLARRTLENRSRNLGRYLMSPGLAPLRGALQGQPLVIVCAGPSLRRNIGALDAAVGHVPMIAVSTALRLLLGRGIVPDFTTLIDYHRISMRYFEGIDPDHAPPMLTELRASNEAVRAYPGVQLFPSDRVLGTFFSEITGELGHIPPSSSVASTAFHLATWMGADPVIFCGLDLSYPGGLLHVPGTAVHNPVFPQCHRFYNLEMRELEYYLTIRGRMRKVPAIPEGEVPTEDVLFSYIKELEASFARYPGRVVDATEGGARLAGTETARLAEVLAEYHRHEAPDLRGLVQRATTEMAAEERRARGLALIDELEEELRELTGIYHRMLPHLERALKKTARGDIADREARELQRLDREAMQRRRATQLLREHAQADVWLRQKSDRYLDLGREKGVEMQQKQAERDRAYVQALVHATDVVRDALARARSSVESITSGVHSV